jgi:hypothetical protein
MDGEAKQEAGISRRNFLKFGSGLFGLTLGALGLSSLGWAEISDVTADRAEADTRLARRHHRRSSTASRAVRRAQEQLKAAGFDPGPADGHIGPNTRAALRNYQAAHSLPQTGRLDRATQRSLMGGA